MQPPEIASIAMLAGRPACRSDFCTPYTLETLLEAVSAVSCRSPQ
jgi:hypothetical protein